MNENTGATVFIGGGNMATALIGGRVAAGANASGFRVVEPSASQRDSLAARFAGIRVFPAMTAEAVADADLVVFAVKPQQMAVAAKALAPHVGGVGVVLTIAAGIRTSDLSRWLGGYRRIVRAMPNTPALIGAGISGVYAAPDVAVDAREATAAILRAAGEVLWFDDEAALDGVTGVSGSGPAYVFYFLESLEDAARELGFSPDDARKLAYATFSGAIALAQKSDADPATLRAQVTSKGGTTERALATLDAQRVKASIVAAVKNAVFRAREMGEEFGKDP
ncbi:MAG TPA: pyrroline-5-carboxylate reductase [Casimicrobiaceae bacterium]